MNLYKMNAQIQWLLERLVASVDDETGEVDSEIVRELDTLSMARDTKLENIGIFIKSLVAEAEAIRTEEIKLAKRRVVKENTVNRLKEYVANNMLSQNQMKFDSPRVAYSFRRSEAVNITGDVPKKYMTRTVTEKPDRKAITAAIKAGQKVRGAELVEKQNLQIK